MILVANSGYLRPRYMIKRARGGGFLRFSPTPATLLAKNPDVPAHPDTPHAQNITVRPPQTLPKPLGVQGLAVFYAIRVHIGVFGGLSLTSNQ